MGWGWLLDPNHFKISDALIIHQHGDSCEGIYSQSHVEDIQNDFFPSSIRLEHFTKP